MVYSIYEIVSSQFKLNLHGDHGITHWKHVQKIGEYLAKGENVDIKVVRLFAVIHDSQRIDEFIDPDHGLRAAEFAQSLFKDKVLNITSKQLEQLVYACKYHSDKHAKSNDLTIQICWDSDRLDLWRLGIYPDSMYLYTRMAKMHETLVFAKQLQSS